MKVVGLTFMPLWFYKLMLYFDLPLATHPSEK